MCVWKKERHIKRKNLPGSKFNCQFVPGAHMDSPCRKRRIWNETEAGIFSANRYSTIHMNNDWYGLFCSRVLALIRGIYGASWWSLLYLFSYIYYTYFRFDIYIYSLFFARFVSFVSFTCFPLSIFVLVLVQQRLLEQIQIYNIYCYFRPKISPGHFSFSFVSNSAHWIAPTNGFASKLFRFALWNIVAWVLHHFNSRRNS